MNISGNLVTDKFEIFSHVLDQMNQNFSVPKRNYYPFVAKNKDLPFTLEELNNVILLVSDSTSRGMFNLKPSLFKSMCEMFPEKILSLVNDEYSGGTYSRFYLLSMKKLNYCHQRKLSQHMTLIYGTNCRLYHFYIVCCCNHD